MKNKYVIACLGVLFFALPLSFSNAYAHHESGYGGMELEEMFFGKAHFILENHEALGLPEDKVEAIKNLKLETKKSLIKQNADIEIVYMDIMAKLHDYPVDVEAVNKLVDQKYELKKAETKSLVGAIAKLKSTLTKDQYDKLHKLWEANEKSEHQESN